MLSCVLETCSNFFMRLLSLNVEDMMCRKGALDIKMMTRNQSGGATSTMMANVHLTINEHSELADHLQLRLEYVLDPEYDELE